MKRILVMCTGNSTRSQMAQGYLQHFAGNRAQVFSAGVETHGLNLKAVQIMADDGIDISHHTSNHVSEYAGISFDYVITVCDHAQERCPIWLGNATRIHQNFTDPSKATGSVEEIWNSYKSVRNEIRDFSLHFAQKELS
ncbi:arsenate reductase ArsC [Spirosoma sp. BT702]|uniref:Arsenate reductase ArsC n=1 Tax=Spirosoma profusum TaxID=2771354 RepID=A0A926XX41_9BACT|nr:arsenate reductase ArsC [Spirosoma profusum]MBD2702219.1 arsenate reductase ArsC [Spirosoma profusum]